MKLLVEAGHERDQARPVKRGGRCVVGESKWGDAVVVAGGAEANPTYFALCSYERRGPAQQGQ